MGRIAFSINALGAGLYDGEMALLRYGGERAKMRWIQAANAWIGEENIAIEFRDGEYMVDANGGLQGTWDYFKQPPSGVTEAWGWSPQAIMNANLAYNAGLVLQENLKGVYWSFNALDLHQLALVWYPFADGGTISPLIFPDDTTPGRNVGAILDSLPGQRRFSTTGWVDSPIDVPTQPILAPHLYTRFVSGPDTGQASRLEYLLARWRWVGVPS